MNANIPGIPTVVLEQNRTQESKRKQNNYPRQWTQRIPAEQPGEADTCSAAWRSADQHRGVHPHMLTQQPSASDSAQHRGVSLAVDTCQAPRHSHPGGVKLGADRARSQTQHRGVRPTHVDTADTRSAAWRSRYLQCNLEKCRPASG